MNTKNEAQFICSCDWSTNNEGAYDAHVRFCKGRWIIAFLLKFF